MRSNKLISLLISLQFIASISAQLSSSNLPIVVVTTEDEIPDEPKIEGSIGIIYDTTGGINSITESFNYYSSNLAIETRGNSTQGFDKKTYSLELRNSADEDTSVNLFGMGGEEDLSLIHI